MLVGVVLGPWEARVAFQHPGLSRVYAWMMSWRLVLNLSDLLRVPTWYLGAKGVAHSVPVRGGGRLALCGSVAAGVRLTAVRGRQLDSTELCYECLGEVFPRVVERVAAPVTVGLLTGVTDATVVVEVPESLF